MEEIVTGLYRFLIGIFQWALIYSFFISIGSGFIWIFSLGKLPNKKMLEKNDMGLFFLGILVLLGALNLTYCIFK